MKWRFSGRFLLMIAAMRGNVDWGKENQSQLARRDAKTGRMDGKGREGMTEWEKRKGKRVRRGLEKREKKRDIVQLTV